MFAVNYIPCARPISIWLHNCANGLNARDKAEGLQATDLYGQPNIMRAEDHQLLQPFYTALFTKPVKYDSEKTGLGWKTQSTSSIEQLTFPTSCKMKRPSGA